MPGSSTLRALDFNAYMDVVEHIAEAYDSPPSFVVGTVAPYRPFEEIEDEAAVAEDEPSMFHDEAQFCAEDSVKRFGDFAYPAWAFENRDSTADIERADTQLVGLTVFSAEHVRDVHHAAMNADDIIDHLLDLEAEYGERILMTGAFDPPGSHYTIVDQTSVKNIGSLHYPAGAFADSGIADLRSANVTLQGTLILDREDCAQQIRELADGDREAVEPPSEVVS